LLFLQLAQAGGIGRGDVDGDVVGQRIDAFHAVQVVAGRVLVGGVLVLADVDAQQAALAPGPFDVAYQRVHALVVEAQAVDHRLRGRQPEHARLRVARLRT